MAPVGCDFGGQDHEGLVAVDHPPQRTVKTKKAVELATLERVSWFNHQQLMWPRSNVPRVDL